MEGVTSDVVAGEKANEGGAGRIRTHVQRDELIVEGLPDLVSSVCLLAPVYGFSSVLVSLAASSNAGEAETGNDDGNVTESETHRPVICVAIRAVEVHANDNSVMIGRS